MELVIKMLGLAVVLVVVYITVACTTVQREEYGCGGDQDCYEQCRSSGEADEDCQGYGYKPWFKEVYDAR